jgi:hypothetical protein
MVRFKRTTKNPTVATPSDTVKNTVGHRVFDCKTASDTCRNTRALETRINHESH